MQVSGVKQHIWHAGGAKTICTSHVLAAFGIEPSTYHYSGKTQQMAAILRRNGYAVRSRRSWLRKRKTVGAARAAIRAMQDPPGTKYLLILVYGTSRHAVLVDANGATLVDTDPREADRRRIVDIRAVFTPSIAEAG